MFRLRYALTLIAAIIAAAPAISDETYRLSQDRAVKPLQSFRECDVCPQMVVLPMGRFRMGSSVLEIRQALEILLKTRGLGSPLMSTQQEEIFQNERPDHEVEIDIPFAIGLNEVTREEWAACVADGHCTEDFEARIRFRKPYGPYQDHPRSPVSAVTFTDIQDYIAWLNAKSGTNRYRLPTEAEWEYAARAGTTTPFAQGETLTRAQANYGVHWIEWEDGEYAWHHDPNNEMRPISVDLLDAANPWGLRHMAGNVSEWTRSCITDRHPAFDTSSRYLAASYRPLGCRRVAKGGFYNGSHILARPAGRSPRSEDGWSPWLGFRVLRVLEASHEGPSEASDR